jgi:hypothetical protein
MIALGTIPLEVCNLKTMFMPRQELVIALKKLDQSGQLSVPEVKKRLKKYSASMNDLVFSWIIKDDRIYNFFLLLPPAKGPSWGDIQVNCTCATCSGHILGT